MDELTDAERAELYLKLWWSHDGQWFLKARDAHGIDAAMALNEDVIESMGRIEMRLLHRHRGEPEVADAGAFLPLTLDAHRLMGIPAMGALDGASAFTLHVEDCRVWPMTERAGLAREAPGCRGSLRRRHGWASVFFAPERIRWTRSFGRPDGAATCGYRFELLSG